MINCDNCTEWYHSACVDIQVSRFKGKRVWKGPQCSEPDSFLIPKIFMTLAVENSDNEEEQVSFTDYLNRSKSLSLTREPSVFSGNGRSRLTSTPNKKNKNITFFPSSLLSIIHRRSTFGDNQNEQSKPETTTKVKLDDDLPQSSDDTALGSDDGVVAYQQRMEGPIKHHVDFTTTISYTEWTEVQPQAQGDQRDPRYQWKLPATIWTHRFYEFFKRSCTEEMKGCVLTFEYNRVYPKKSARNYVTASAICKRKDCSMKYRFEIEKRPKKNSDVNIVIKPSGALEHDLATTDKRHLSGIRRIEAQKDLNTKRASIFRREKFGSEATDQTSLEKGDYTEVQSQDVLRVARKEILKKQDLHEDILRDLILRREEMRNYPHLSLGHVRGYIQQLGVFPFTVLLYTQKQINIFKKVLAWNSDIVFYLDASGKVSSALPVGLDQTRQFYYALVIKLPLGDAPLIPVVEFVTNSHSAVTISTQLRYFLEQVRSQTSIKKSGCGIRRIETDDSMAMISACTTALEVGTVLNYLKIAWKRLSEAANGYGKRHVPYVHHVCRKHAMDFLHKKISEHFKGRHTAGYADICKSKMTRGTTLIDEDGSEHDVDVDTHDAIGVMKKWMHGFLHGRDLYSFCRRVMDVVILCGCRDISITVLEITRDISEKTTRKGAPWEVVNLNELPSDPPFYRQSPFSQFAIIVATEYDIQLDFSDQVEDDYSGATNPYYCPPFLRYLIKHVLVIGCLFDHSLMRLNDISTLSDTQGSVESWNDILKVDELAAALPMRIGRFCSAEEKILKGRLNEFDLALARLLRTSNSRRDSYVEDERDEEIICSSARSNQFKSGQFGSQNKNMKSKEMGDVEVPESQKESWRPKKSKPPPSGIQQTELHHLNRIPWGGFYMFEGKKVSATNTCAIDCQLQIIYTMYKIFPDVREQIKSYATQGNFAGTILARIFGLLDNESFDEARGLTLKKLMNYSPAILESGDFFDSEEKFLDAIRTLVPIVRRKRCKNSMCNLHDKADQYATEFFVSNLLEAKTKFNRQIIKCVAGSCKGKFNCEIWYKWPEFGPSAFLTYSVPLPQGNHVFVENDILMRHNMVDEAFKVFAYSVRRGGAHFYVVFCYNRKKFIYDGLTAGRLLEFKPAPKGHSVSTVWLHRDQV
ncbi:CXXC-type zinc finger protein 1 [Folsomia candida]|uniref:CXXC-type zinc finger protein 1 n=2 Tax=Folsomia candida TaxID=158441 RepID=A0A226DX22_FOLCA|nr:CXXC-type zinc finger protein 1 [Folsomia candida]